MKAPFPYHGGKSRWAQEILDRFGKLDRYVEPFAGSMAVLLHREPFPYEVVCDKSGLIANFWRAVKFDPERTSWWADYPTFHDDLTARHKWLVDWVKTNSAELKENADYYDPKAAGWWCWGMSNWIGKGFCNTDKEPGNQIPHIKDSNSGMGVSAQKNMEAGEIAEWIGLLSTRIKKIVVLNRDWSSAVKPGILGRTAVSNLKTGVLLDPPYLLGERTKGIYADDGDDAAKNSYDWAVENGLEYRIAYCCHHGDFHVPEGWDAEIKSFSVIKRQDRKDRKDMVMFSPGCLAKGKKESGQSLDRFL